MLCKLPGTGAAGSRTRRARSTMRTCMRCTWARLRQSRRPCCWTPLWRRCGALTPLCERCVPSLEGLCAPLFWVKQDSLMTCRLEPTLPAPGTVCCKILPTHFQAETGKCCAQFVRATHEHTACAVGRLSFCMYGPAPPASSIALVHGQDAGGPCGGVPAAQRAAQGHRGELCAAAGAARLAGCTVWARQQRRGRPQRSHGQGMNAPSMAVSTAAGPAARGTLRQQAGAGVCLGALACLAAPLPRGTAAEWNPRIGWGMAGQSAIRVHSHISLVHARLISTDAQRWVASCTFRRLSAWSRVCDMSGFPVGVVAHACCVCF